MLKLFDFCKILVLISVLILAEYYIMLPSFTVRAFSFALLVVIYIAFVNPFFSVSPIADNTKSVMLWAMVFITYILISDFLKNNPFESFKDWIVNVPAILFLPIFEDKKSDMNILKPYLIIFGFSMLFALLQIFGLGHNLGTLIPNIGPVSSTAMIDSATVSGYRVSGAIYSVIGFAEDMAILIIMLYFFFYKRRKIVFLIALSFSILILFSTQTRAAIFGIIPAILVSHFFIEKMSFKKMFQYTVLIGAILFSLFAVKEAITEKFTYVFQDKEFNLTEEHRFTANYYMIKGVLEESPLFGISKEAAWEIFIKHADIPGYVINSLMATSATPTHHNQFGYYFRYYGIVGIILLAILYLNIFRKIMQARSELIRMCLVGIFVFDLIYSMGHNNKLVSNPILWILLSLASNNASNLKSSEVPVSEELAAHTHKSDYFLNKTVDGERYE